MPGHRYSYRRREKPPFERFKDHCRAFTAFMFSNVGIILLVIFYTIGGAIIFQAIEISEHERHKHNKPHKFIQRNFTGECLQKIWDVTSANISFFDNMSFKGRIDNILLEFQREVVHKQLRGEDIEKQWSFSGAFLYSLTVITTIGYGNISPQSDWGKLVTILYAILGMPLFLLYLSNIGDVLAKSFKWIYSKVCLCRICPGVARRRMIRERRKQRRLKKRMRNRENQNSGSNSGSQYSSSSNDASNDSNSSYSSKYNEDDDDETESSSQTTSAVAPYNSADDNDNDNSDNDDGEAEDDDDDDDDDDSSYSDIDREIAGGTDEITVPLTVCITIMISYILAGAILFGRYEEWDYLDGSYFCLISLSSIGFGDLVPGDRVITADKDKVELSFILCAVYLLLGMALIAMCFNLMQEQVIHNMRAVKKAFKACFRCKR